MSNRPTRHFDTSTLRHFDTSFNSEASARPLGDIDDAMRDLQHVVAVIRKGNGRKPVVLLAHSRGGVVTARYASEHQTEVSAQVLFAPVVTRPVEVEGE